MRTGDDEAASPKYAHIERERRFLVDPARVPALDSVHAVRIEDRYITGTRMRLRRMTDIASGAMSLKLTKKYDAADASARPIVTAYLDDAEFAVLAALPARDVDRIRYDTDSDGARFGVDVFAGALTGLAIAEIERDDAASLAAVRAPVWAALEVTHDDRFSGGNLVAMRSDELMALLDATRAA